MPSTGMRCSNKVALRHDHEPALPRLWLGMWACRRRQPAAGLSPAVGELGDGMERGMLRGAVSRHRLGKVWMGSHTRRLTG